MTTKSYDSALDFMPNARTSGARWFSILKVLVDASREGREAEARYHGLVARGMAHDEAARVVFAQIYKS